MKNEDYKKYTKKGIIQTTANQEIKYDFKIKNTGNVPLSNFTWFDYLPTDYVRITKHIWYGMKMTAQQNYMKKKLKLRSYRELEDKGCKLAKVNIIWYNYN